MKVTVVAQISHLCPYVDEIDHGVVTFVFPSEAPELHTLRGVIDSFHTEKITHEEVTTRLAKAYPEATVTTEWTTAGMAVGVEG